jgi:hypothetical protein
MKPIKSGKREIGFICFVIAAQNDYKQDPFSNETR